MFKTTAIVAVLCVASTAVAQLNQGQDVTAALGNAIELLEGQGSANASHTLVIGNNQQAGDCIGCGPLGMQNQTGLISQIGDAVGNCSVIGLLQELAVGGAQEQIVGANFQPKAQGQSLGIVAAQGLSKAEGAGNATASHGIVLDQNQNAANAAGGMTESSSVAGWQNSSINGAAGSVGAVGSSMTVSTNQVQAVN